MNTTELFTSAVAVTCEKRERASHNSPAVVAKHRQSAKQSDWVITAITVNGVPFADWCDKFDLRSDVFVNYLGCKFNTKKAAAAAVVENIVETFGDPSDYWDQEQFDRYWKVMDFTMLDLQCAL